MQYTITELYQFWQTTVFDCERSEAEAPKAPSLRKGAPSTVTWEKRTTPGSFNIDFSKNHLRAKNLFFFFGCR